MSEDFDAAVVGSGPNGLVAAITLAQAGRRVLVVEAQETIGGSARTLPLTLPGFRHDHCSAIHPMALASPALRALELDLEWVHPPSPLVHPLDGEPAAVLERDPHETAATLGKGGARWAREVAPFLARWEALLADALAPLGIPASPLLMARFGLASFRSAVGLAESWLPDPRGQAFFAGLAAHSMLPLERVPSAAIGLMLALAGHAGGWPFPRGGAQAIPAALARVLRGLGGEIRSGWRVSTLAELPTRGPVLFECSPRALSAICASELPAGYLARLGRYRYGPGVFKIDWALSAPVPWTDPACHRTACLHLGGSLAEIAAGERAAWNGEHVARPYVLFAQPSLFDDSRAPLGQHTAWAYCHVPNGSEIDCTEQIEAQVERFAPGFLHCILARNTVSAAAFEGYEGGDINVGAADVDQLFTRPVARWSPYTTPNYRIFLCSAATPPGGGVHGMAGYFAAKAALERFRG